MDSTVTWLIIALFYAPLHFLVPLLVVLVRSEGPQRRRRALRLTLLDCSLSMAASFALVIWLAGSARLTTAMLVLLLSLALPYIRIFTRRPSPAEGTEP